jgi:hypothetical protein
VNRKIFQTLALERLSDAETFLNARKYSGAYYLAGYSIECALKACIARRVKRYDFPLKDAAKYYTHDLEELVQGRLETGGGRAAYGFGRRDRPFTYRSLGGTGMSFGCGPT